MGISVWWTLTLHIILENNNNLSLYKATNDSHPVFIGPIMVHLHQDKQAYLTFVMELKKYDLLNEKS